MKALLTSIFLLAPLLLFAQNRTAHIPLNEKRDTSYWYGVHTKGLKELQIRNLKTDTATRSMRFWYYGQTVSHFIEVFQNKNAGLEGNVTIYTKEQVKSEKEKPTNRTFARRIAIAPDKCKIIQECFHARALDTVPSEDQVKGWGSGFDGVIYVVEQANETDYSFKSYWSPAAQKDVPEAQNMLNFIKDLDSVLDITSKRNVFTNQIPYESYNTGGPAVIARVLTLAQYIGKKQERAKFRRRYAKGKAELVDKNW